MTFENFFDYLKSGFFHPTWWQLLLLFYVITHFTMLSTTVYLHRSQTHGALRLHPIIIHFFRFWLWLTSATDTKEWVAVHRKHHKEVDGEHDPHSPVTQGIWRILFLGSIAYRKEANNPKTLEEFGKGTPDDFLERHLYHKHTFLGVFLLLFGLLIFFGWKGILFWLLEMIWIPFWAAGVVNGLGHWVVYRRYNTPDNSRNLDWLLGIFGFIAALVVLGEQTHNKHHERPSSAKISDRWYEIDIGWWYIKLFRFLRLAKVLHS